MKKLLLTVIVGLGMVQFADAGDSDVKACKDSVKATFQSCVAESSGSGSEAMNACVEAKNIGFEDCKNGGSLCENSCTVALEAANNECDTTFDPNSCLGDVICEILIEEQLSQCKTDAQTSFNSCISSCN